MNMDISGDRIIRIGMVLSDISDFYQQEILSGALAAAESRDIRIIGLNDRQPEFLLRNQLKDSPIFRRIHEGNIDGLIFLTAVMQSSLNREELRYYADSYPSVPRISLGVPLEGLHTLETDNRRGMEKITRHLIEKHRCRKIAYLSGPPDNLEVEYRLQGFKAVLESSGIPFDPRLVYQGDFLPGSGKAAVQNLVDQQKLDFDAFICVDDYMAFEVIESLKSRGIDVPGDCLVTGFDNVEHSEFSSPGLTTIHQPLFEMGYESVLMIEKKIRGTGEVRDRRVDLALVIRESCSCREPITDIIDGPGKEPPFSQKKCKEAIQEYIDELEKEGLSEYSLYSSRLNHILIELLKSAQSYGETLDDNRLSREIHKTVTEAARNRLNGLNLIRTLTPLFKGSRAQSRMNFVWDRLRFHLLVSDNHLSGMEKLTRQQRLHILSTSLDFSIGSVTRKSIRKKILRCVTALGIQNMFILIFNPETEEMDSLLALSEGNYLPHKGVSLGEQDMIPWKYEADQRRSYYFLPLYSRDQVLGYLYIETGKMSFPIYVDLLYRITSGVEGIFLMEKINRYTDHLEEEISLRTRELEQANRQLKDLSYNDPLTGLKNRRFLEEAVKPIVEGFLQDYLYNNPKDEKRSVLPPPPMAAFIMDIDHFKKVNDRYGHDAGDKVIKGMARVLQKTCRSKDSIIRMGGEEFLIIMQGIEEASLMDKAEEIRQALASEDFQLNQGLSLNVTCSIGCLSIPSGLSEGLIFSLEETIILIDQAMYHAKETGRNKSVTLHFSPNLEQKKILPHEVISRFDQWIQQGDISFRSAQE